MRYLREAAADATGRLGFEEAVTLAERALSLSGVARLDGPTRLGLLLEVADARRLAGRLALAAGLTAMRTPSHASWATTGPRRRPPSACTWPG